MSPVGGDDWPAGHLARRQYTRNTRARARPSSRADVGVYTLEHVSALSLSLHALAVDCPRSDVRRRWCLYVLILVDRQTIIYMQRTSAHSFTLHPVDRPQQEANKLFFV